MEIPEKPRSRFANIHIDTFAAAARSISSAFATRDVAPAADGHASTPPIAVPSSVVSSWQDRNAALLENTGGGGPGDSAHYMSPGLLSPIEKAARARKPSISFDHTLKTDEGHQLPLQSRLPRSSVSSLAPPAGPLDESSQATSLPTTGSEYCPPSPTVGGISGSLNSRSGLQSGGDGMSSTLRRTRPRRRSSAATRFLQALSPNTDTEPVPERVASLTSDSTMSPMSEFHTPPPAGNPMGDMFVDRGNLTQSPMEDELALQESSPWNWQNSYLSRSKTLSYEGRPRSRSARRTFSARTPTSACSSKSPASAFLQQFNSGPVQAVEPDSEGQEVGSFVLGKEIGRGGFSTVKEAFTFDDDVKVTLAVKIVRKRAADKDSDNDKVQADLEQEIQLWRCLSHPNILRLQMVYDTPFATFAFMQLNRGGSLYDLLKKNRQGIPARLAQRYGYQLACAIRYLHEDMRIVHGDVKLENCLLDMTNDEEDGGNILLCDFGLARFIKSPHEDDLASSSGSSSSSNSQRPKTAEEPSVGGSLQYAAPEMITSSLATPASDMWAYAVVLYALYTGSLPFNHAFAPNLQAMIMKGDWDVEKLRSSWGLVELNDEDETEKVIEVVSGGLCKDVMSRLTVREVLESRWLERFGGESP